MINKENKEKIMSCACCNNKGEIRIKVSLCSDCFDKVMQKYDKEKKPYDESDIFAENKYWGFE